MPRVEPGLVRGTTLRRYAEPAERPGPHARRLRTRGRDTEAPQRPSPPVAHRCRAAPLPVDGHPVVTGPRGIECVQDEGEIAAGQAAGGPPEAPARGIRRPARGRRRRRSSRVRAGEPRGVHARRARGRQ